MAGAFVQKVTVSKVFGPAEPRSDRNFLHENGRLRVVGFDEVSAVRHDVLEWQQRDVGERLVVDRVALGAEAVDGLPDLHRVPVKDRVGDKAQAAGFVHDLDVVAGLEVALVGEVNPARQSLAVLPLVQLSLDGSAELEVGAVAQDVIGLDESAETT